MRVALSLSSKRKMTVLWALFGLVLLTRPDGSPVWVHPEAALRVESALGTDKGAEVPKAKSKVSGHSGVFWVKETPEEVVRLLLKEASE